MSLGSPFGRNDDRIGCGQPRRPGGSPCRVGRQLRAAAYITGSPGAADRVISVAAIDASRAEMPGALIDLPGGAAIPAINANEAPLPTGPMQVKVLRNPDGTVSLGCDPEEYVDVEDKLVVTLRGACARVRARSLRRAGRRGGGRDDQHDDRVPAVRGPDRRQPGHGEEFLVTIPFLGVRGSSAPTLRRIRTCWSRPIGQTVTLTPLPSTNPGYQILASFTSGGPRNVDSVQSRTYGAGRLRVLDERGLGQPRRLQSPGRRWPPRSSREPRR